MRRRICCHCENAIIIHSAFTRMERPSFAPFKKLFVPLMPFFSNPSVEMIMTRNGAISGRLRNAAQTQVLARDQTVKSRTH